MDRLSLLAAVLSLSVLSACHCCNSKTDDHASVVAMRDVPAAVAATFERESKGGKIGEIEKETKDGRTVYSADVTIDNVEWDIEVAEDGSVISREKEK